MIDQSPLAPGSRRQDWRDWPRTVLPVVTALLLLVLGLANVAERATSDAVEDGVLWVDRSAGVVAAEVANDSAADRVGIRPGDVLIALDGNAVEHRDDVLAIQRRAARGERHTYTLVRLGSREVKAVDMAPVPSGAGALYYVLAAVGIFTLLVGAAVRARRPFDQATLHFFWLAVAFFGVFTFSFTGRFDRADWFFYWADEVALLLLPPLFLHFSLVFPERPRQHGYTAMLARWLPALGYALPFVFGVAPSLPMQLSAIPLGFIPLAFASAIVRYRLMDVEVILKRLLVYGSVVASVVVIYVLILRASGGYFVQNEDEHRWMIAFLATVVVVLLARPVKDAVQSTIDRAFYRDRYDYRRALVAFARDLNGDLDLNRLAERLVSRVKETLDVDRLALMLANEFDEFEQLKDIGFEGGLPRLNAASGVGGRLSAGSVVRLDDPLAVGRFTVEEVEFWRDAGVYYLVPCVSHGTAIAALALGRRESGEPLTSEDMALLTAVAGQAATAIENGRLYHQLHLKAAELDRLRTFNENILESLDDGLLVVGLDQRVIRWNQALERLYGVTRAEALGQPLDRLFEPQFLETLRSALHDKPQGTTLFRMPLVSRGARDGTRLLLNVTTVPLQAIVGGTSPAGTILMLEDITQRTQLEEQLQISEKMASLGILAAGVAHEVNTPLTGISSYTQMLLEQADPNDPRTKVLEKIEKQTFRAARIVNGLLTLSRPNAADAVERAPVDLNTVISDVLALLEHQLEKGSIKIRRELSEQAVPITGYEFKLQQVFLNLILNARDAMPSGGWLTLSTRVEGPEAIAEIADTGNGIPLEHLARIYDPFFTTKSSGQGTGLGLSITYGIVREHDGSIHCDSAPGQGTRFVLRFAAADAGERPAARTASL